MSWHVQVPECAPEDFEALVDALTLDESQASPEHIAQFKLAKSTLKRVVKAGALGPAEAYTALGGSIAGHSNPDFATAPNEPQTAFHLSLYTYTR